MRTVIRYDTGTMYEKDKGNINKEILRWYELENDEFQVYDEQGEKITIDLSKTDIKRPPPDHSCYICKQTKGIIKFYTHKICKKCKDKDYFTQTQVADFMGVSGQTVHKYLHLGDQKYLPPPDVHSTSRRKFWERKTIENFKFPKFRTPGGKIVITEKCISYNNAMNLFNSRMH